MILSNSRRSHFLFVWVSADFDVFRIHNRTCTYMVYVENEDIVYSYTDEADGIYTVEPMLNIMYKNIQNNRLNHHFAQTRLLDVSCD